MEILGAVLGPIVGYTIQPVGRALGYLLFYKRNMKNLETQLKNLLLGRERVQILVNEEKSNSHEIFNEVLTWLVKVDAELSQQNEGGSNRNNDGNLSCFKFGVICYPRKTKKRLDNILRLIDDGKKFDKDNVGYSVPLPSTKCPTLPLDYQILESRTLIAEKVKNALADPTINKVGVSGMGGVGKTKLLDEVKKLVLESNLFDRVIVVTVGTSKDVKRIQDEIGGMLNMKLEANSEEVRASLLQTKIVEMKDKILIVLDDLWEEYDIEKDFGIPCRLEPRKEGHCKILMTSRSRDLLTNQLDTEKRFELNPLNEKESWKFFMAIVGEFVEVGIEQIAKNVVRECGGLPLALKVLAKALKRKKAQMWKDALNKLNKHASLCILGVEDKLYACLKLSYDSVEDEEAKSLFLMCSVFPDDYRISINDLQMFSMGMGMLNDINNWEDARNRVMKLVDDLTSSCLLIYSDIDDLKGKDYYVQMHDVIRDVAKYIASKIYKKPSLTYGPGQREWREEERCGSYYAIFVDYVDFSDLPPKLKFPNLRLLILKGPGHLKISQIQILDASFEGTENLRVLDMKMMRFEPSRTSLTHSLKNLQTLCMTYCECYDIDTIGELTKLKILKIKDCVIEELPASMSQLTELKVLEVTRCRNLKVIHPNVISSMSKLEELSLLDSFGGWGEEIYNERNIKNAKLSELNCLTQLSILRIEIQNADILSNELSLERVRKLQDFYICAGSNDDVTGYIINVTRTLRLHMNSKIIISNGSGALETLLQRCENLIVNDSEGFVKTLFKPNANYVLPRLKYLHIVICEDSKDLAPHQIKDITPFFATDDHQVSFSELKELYISMGNNLEMLWHNDWITANSFCKLQNVSIHYCNQLAYLIPSNMVKSLIFLNTLEVEKCELLERIFEIEELTDDAKVVRLTKLKLCNLPNLKYVWNNDPGECLTFPNLKDVHIYDCPRLKSIFPASFIKRVDKIENLCANGVVNDIFGEDEASKLIMNPEMVIFPSLRSLEIQYKVVEKRSFWLRSESFPKLRSLDLIGSKDDGMVTLPLEMSELIYQNKEFKIRDVFELVQVFQNGKENSQLKTLCLKSLPNLTHVWEDNNQKIKSFDSLESINVDECMKLKSLLPSSITFFNLTQIQVQNCDGMVNLFSSSLANKLVNLKTMNIRGCKGLSSIIVADREEDEEISFNKMNMLTLAGLPQLANFHSGKSTFKFPCLESLVITEWPDHKTFSYDISEENSPTKGLNVIIQNLLTEVSLSELKYLTIKRENNLKALWHNNWLTVNSFCKLQVIRIKYCNQLTCVFPSNMVSSLVFLRTLEVSMCELLETIFEIEEPTGDAKVVPLTMLDLSNLPNLMYVWNNDPGEHLTFPNLKDVYIIGCPRLRSLFPASFVKHMDKIETLDANGEIEIFVKDEASQLFMIPQMVVFPSLSSLTIHFKVVEKEGSWLRSESFPKLQLLDLIGSKDDHDMVSLPLEISELSYRIEKLVIGNAFELVQVFQKGEQNNHNSRSWKMKELFLYDLPQLMRVWEDNNQLTTSFDSLERIEVHKCMSLNRLLPSSITFFNLTEIRVYNCEGMMSLFSSSVAHKLVNLKLMYITKCEGLSSIVVIEGGEDVEIIFKKLNDLILEDLPRLTSFYSGKFMLKFPCLDKLRIRRCHEMKTFSNGIISMPKLLFVKIKKDKVRVTQTRDVNMIIKHFWMVEIGRSIKNLFTQKGEEDSEEDTEKDIEE